MTPKEAGEYLKEKGFKNNFPKVEEFINGNKVVEIKNLVNGKPTYSSTWICRKEPEK